MSEITPGAGAPASTIDKPTRKSEWTLLLALGVAIAGASVFTAAILWARWPDDVAPKRLWFLGWGLLVCLGLIGFVIVAIASPWTGRVRVSGPLGSIETGGGQ